MAEAEGSSDDTELDWEAAEAEAEAEALYSDERMWPAPLRELLRSPPSRGGPAYPRHNASSSTGLLCAVAPMLLHRSVPPPADQGVHFDPHVERPARIVAIYHRLLVDGLVARCCLVPAREAADADLHLVHSPAHVARATKRYSSDDKACAKLNLEPGSDTFFAAGASGRAARLAAGSLVELVTRVVSGELSNAAAVVRPPGHHCEVTQVPSY